MNKSLRSLIAFVVILGSMMWYCSDTRSPEERKGSVAVDPGAED